jgi:hypothetical protein
MAWLTLRKANLSQISHLTRPALTLAANLTYFRGLTRRQMAARFSFSAGIGSTIAAR